MEEEGARRGGVGSPRGRKVNESVIGPAVEEEEKKRIRSGGSTVEVPNPVISSTEMTRGLNKNRHTFLSGQGTLPMYV